VKTLVFGATGQLASALRHRRKGASFQFLDRAQVDLSDAGQVAAAIRRYRPQITINVAAYTAVDRAETERDAAFTINEGAPRAMAQACADIDARLIHVSTDYVFDGAKNTPYRPDDATCPVNVYGASKLAGEQAIAATAGLNFLIVRTSWVYSGWGRNFMLTMLKLGPDKGRLRVVADQIGTPTSAHSLAESILHAAQRRAATGIVHFTDAGVASWYDFAQAIFEEATLLGRLSAPVIVEPIATTQYPTPARRPAYSVLDKTTAYAGLGLQPVHWRVRLREVLRSIP
jgi:dTDP-4-dehydrorhamnose reductase